MPNCTFPFLALAVLGIANAAAFIPEQAIKMRRFSDLTLSPDGSLLACVLSEPLKGDKRQSHIWLLDMRSKQMRQWTFSTKSESSPRWSPDGRTLAFLSDRDERNQIYTIRIDGGEAVALTSGKNAVNQFRWSPDGRQIAFLASEPKSEEEEKKEKDKDDAQVSDREKELARAWNIDVATRQVRQITKGIWRIEQIEWIAGDRLLAVASDQPRSEEWTEALYTIALPDGKFTLFGKPAQPFGGITVSPDLKTIGYVGTRDSGPVPHDFFLQPTSGEPALNVTAQIDRPVYGMKWRDSTTALIAVGDGFQVRLYSVSTSGSNAPLTLPNSAEDFAIARNGTVVWVGETATKPPELYLEQSGGKPEQVSHIQDGWESVTLAEPQTFRFKSFDGTEVEAALLKPAKADGAGAKLPLVLLVHGGPTGAFTARIETWAQLLAARGYAVLMVNPRGSSNYGEAFLKANRADWGGADFKDLMVAVDAVLAKGETDPERIGIAGWSYGGYMAEWAITQTQRFKAAVSGAGMFDLANEFATENGPAYDEWFFGTPWEHPDRFAHSSPAAYIKNAKTPTLILQGENDRVDPAAQSSALYRALKRYGVPCELVIYPREPHGPQEEKHQLDILTRMPNWFDKYLKAGVSTSESR